VNDICVTFLYYYSVSILTYLCVLKGDHFMLIWFIVIPLLIFTGMIMLFLAPVAIPAALALLPFELPVAIAGILAQLGSIIPDLPAYFENVAKYLPYFFGG